MMTSTYLRQMGHARRDAEDLASLLERSGELTVEQLSEAIGLAYTAHRALLAARKSLLEGPPA